MCRVVACIFLVCALHLAEAQIASGGNSVYGNNQQAGRYIRLRGINLYYETYGQGQPLLMLHFNGGSISAFSYNIPYFSRYYKVIAVDSRGHGKTIDNGDSLTFEMMADDFNALLDSLRLDSCYVIGWSDGAISGLLLAIRHPDKVKKLAITGANLWPDTTGLLPNVWADINNNSAELRKKPQTAEIRNELKISDLDIYEPHIALTQLHTIRCPVLVIGGDHDAIPVPHTVLIAESIPRSYLWIIPESGHSTPVLKRDQFNQIVHNFFVKPYREIKGRDVYR